MRAITRKPAAREPRQDGNDRHGPLADALNGSAAVQAQMALSETLNARPPVQRMMNDSDDEEVVRDPKANLIAAIGKQAIAQGLTLPEGNGEFISSSAVGNDDFQRNTAHIHVYKKETAVTDDTAVLAGHAVWNKRGGQNRQRFQIKATKGYDGWTAEPPDWGEGEEKVRDANPDAKQKLFDIVENELPDLFAIVLSDNYV